MKPVLLLIPGMLNAASVWSEVLPRLAGRVEPRIAEVWTQASIAQMARDAWASLAELPPEVPVVLCGFSMGGYVAIEMLAQGVRPVAALALLDSSARPESAEGALQREKTIAAIGRDFERVVAGVASFTTHEARHADAVFMERMRAELRAIGAEAAIRQNRALVGRADHRALLAGLRLPATVMCGRFDRVTPPALSEELAALIPGAGLEWIEDAGHMTPLEQPAQVAALLDALLAQIHPGARP